MSAPKVVMYAADWCGYCARARRLLDAKGVQYEEIDVTGDVARRTEMINASGRRTVPQIFIDEQSIGGFDELYELEQGGELDGLLSGPS